MIDYRSTVPSGHNWMGTYMRQIQEHTEREVGKSLGGGNCCIIELAPFVTAAQFYWEHWENVPMQNVLQS